MAREGYTRGDASAKDLSEIIGHAGFRRFAKQHWRTGITEMRGSLSKRSSPPPHRHYVPDLTVANLVPAAAGIRAQAMDPDGSLVDDFRITRTGAVTAVRNAPSPSDRPAELLALGQ